MKKIISFCLALCATTALWAGTSNFRPAAFSVAEGTQIAFSQGNLQYTKSTDAWLLAENQYDMIGSANVSGDALADKIDLFGWSGNNETAKWGISTSYNNGDYSGDFVDWGTNTIGTAAPNTYRTLTYSEWDYLLNTRDNAESKKGVAHINLNSDGSQYANGLILLPDSWVLPEGASFTSGFASEYNAEAYATYQTFTLSEWQKLEAAGAVFLPASGLRGESDMFNVQSDGYYWSATADGSTHACSLIFYSDGASAGRYNRDDGRAVRLVRDVHVNIAAVTNGTVEVDNLGAAEGETVTLTITPDNHYALKSLVVMQGETEIALTAVAGASNQYTFTMPAGDVAVNAEFEKIAPAAFSIADGKYIYFSQGDLQCTLSATDTTWSFAENQYDMIGGANIYGWGFLADKIDLFGWSGSTGSAKWGISASTNPADYAGDFVDWGKNIGDGDTYRTLTKDEWDYLLINRTGASEKQGVAHINITEDGAQAANGLILLPDNWVCPDGITFTNDSTNYAANTFTLAQWQKLEAAGAIFLPAAGWRMVQVIDVQSVGNYWTATPALSNYAYRLRFGYDKANANDAVVCMSGFAVRLVQDLHAVNIAAAENGTVTIDKPAAAEGEMVTITVTPAEGYEVESITVTYGDSQEVEVSEENTFVMPAGEVTITVVFKESSTAIETIEIIDLRTENGSVIYDGEFQIFDLLGRNVTRLNGSLNGVYIVKIGDKAQKVIVSRK